MLQQSYILLSCTRRLSSHMPIVLSLIDLKLAIKIRVELTAKLSGFGFCQSYILKQQCLSVWAVPEKFFQSLPVPQKYSLSRKAVPGFLLCIFSSRCLPEETCFQQVGSSVVESTRRLYWDILTSGRYQPTYHYFLKSEKIPTLLYVGKGLSTGPSVIFDLFPWAEYWPFRDF